jgi:hypothetical protein
LCNFRNTIYFFLVIVLKLKHALNFIVLFHNISCEGEKASLHQKNNFLVLPAILLMLNAIDVTTTAYGLSHGLNEGNPLFSFAIIPEKFLGCGILLAASWFTTRLSSATRYVNIAILSVVVVYLFVVGNNLFLILRI